MPKRLVRRLAPVFALGAATATAFATSVVAPGVADAPPELRLGIDFERPTASLGRVLGHEQLVARYSCMLACDPVMRLKVGGVQISHFDPPGGATAGNRAAVFELSGGDRQAIRTRTHDGIAHFYLRGVFTTKSAPGSEAKSLRFQLRR